MMGVLSEIKVIIFINTVRSLKGFMSYLIPSRTLKCDPEVRGKLLIIPTVLPSQKQLYR
jgi:hypothetical protein